MTTLTTAGAPSVHVAASEPPQAAVVDVEAGAVGAGAVAAEELLLRLLQEVPAQAKSPTTATAPQAQAEQASAVAQNLLMRQAHRAGDADVVAAEVPALQLRLAQAPLCWQPPVLQARAARPMQKAMHGWPAELLLLVPALAATVPGLIGQQLLLPPTVQTMPALPPSGPASTT